VAGFERNFWAGNLEVNQAGQRAEREALGLSEELKNPSPVSDADPSIPRGLFHPNCEYSSAHALRKDFSNIKSELN